MILYRLVELIVKEIMQGSTNIVLKGKRPVKLFFYI